jgi:hypothetical protein
MLSMYSRTCWVTGLITCALVRGEVVFLGERMGPGERGSGKVGVMLRLLRRRVDHDPRLEPDNTDGSDERESIGSQMEEIESFRACLVRSSCVELGAVTKGEEIVDGLEKLRSSSIHCQFAGVCELVVLRLRRRIGDVWGSEL